MTEEKPQLVSVGDTIGNFLTGEVYHTHGTHLQPDGSWKKMKCPTCGYDYDEGLAPIPL